MQTRTFMQTCSVGRQLPANLHLQAAFMNNCFGQCCNICSYDGCYHYFHHQHHCYYEHYCLLQCISCRRCFAPQHGAPDPTPNSIAGQVKLLQMQMHVDAETDTDPMGDQVLSFMSSLLCLISMLLQGPDQYCNRVEIK